MRLVAPLATSLLSAALLFTAGSAGATETCATLPAAPAVSAETPARVVRDYSAAVQNHIDCLRQQVNTRRDSLSRAEKEALAAQMSRAAYAERKLRLDYGTAVRATNRPTEVAVDQVAALPR